jgi:hypothetical protein
MMRDAVLHELLVASTWRLSTQWQQSSGGER